MADLHCGNCRKCLVSGIDLCFQSFSDHVHLCLKALDLPSTISKKTPSKNDECKVSELLCSSCQQKVGSVIMKPFSAATCQFSQKHVVMLHGNTELPRKWKDLVKDPGCNSISHYNLNSSLYNREKDRPVETTNYCFPPVIDRITRSKPRDYQLELFRDALHCNHLVYLPTGAGKTLVAAMVLSAMKSVNPCKTCFFVVHKIVLACQQAEYLKRELPHFSVEWLAGSMDPGTIENITKKAALGDLDVLVVTAELLRNILKSPRSALRMTDACVVVIDEAHNTIGKTPYSKLLSEYYKPSPVKSRPLILALTASPGGENCLDSTAGTIVKLQRALFAANITSPSKNSTLSEYVSFSQMERVEVSMTEGEKHLQDIIQAHIRYLLDVFRTCILDVLGDVCAPGDRSSLQKHAILLGYVNYGGIVGIINEVLQICRRTATNNTSILSLSDHLLRMITMVNMNDILGHLYTVYEWYPYFQALYGAKTPHQNHLMKSIIGANEILNKSYGQLFQFVQDTKKVLNGRLCLLKTGSRQEKLVDFLLSLVLASGENLDQMRVLIFTERRRTADWVLSMLRDHGDIFHQLNPEVCYGSGTGIDKKVWTDELHQIMNRFRKGASKLLICTSVLDEGIDVPECKAVVRFDSVMSLRSLVQSRGRARWMQSNYYVLLRPDETHEITRLVSQEENMKNIIEKLTVRNLAQLGGSQAHFWKCPTLPCTSVVPPESSTLPSADPDVPMNVVIQDDNSVFYSSMDASQGPLADSSDFLMGIIDTEHQLNWSCDKLTVSIYCFEDEKRQLVLHMPMLRNERCLCKHDVAKGCVQHFLFDVCRPDNGAESENLSISDWFLKFWFELKPRVLLSVDSFISGDPGLQNTLDAQSLTLGSFITPTLFSPSWYSHGNEVEVLFDHQQRSMSIFAEAEQEGRIRLLVQYTDMHQFLLLDPQNADHLLYICLKVSPKISILTTDVPVRLCKLTDYDPDLCMVACLRLTSAAQLIHNCLCSLQKLNKETLFAHVVWETPATGTVKHVLTDNDPQIAYALHVLYCSGSFMTACLFSLAFFEKLKGIVSQLKAKSGDPKIPFALYKFAKDLNGSTFIDPISMLDSLGCEDPNEVPLSDILDDPVKRAVVPHVYVTPLRSVARPPIIVNTNRILRRYGAEKFVRVSFRDEDFEKISSVTENINHISARIISVLIQGIHVGGRLCNFLAFSNSMVKEHSVWFVFRGPNNESTAQEMRADMGDFSHIRCVAKYMARMAICFSSTMPSLDIKDDEWGRIPDEIDQEKHNFTDGIGTISKELLDQVSRKVGAEMTAIQMRFAGSKGVLALDPSLQGRMMRIRDSMWKFETTSRTLEYVNRSSPLQVYLNHQLIMLMSNAGIEDCVFLGLLRKYLKELAIIFVHFTEILYCATSIFGENNNKLISSRVPVTEPFFRSLALTVFKLRLQDLLEKARIPIGKDSGRVLLGIVDETKSLQSGEVYVAISTDMCAPANGCRVIEGKVVVARPPCLHPGDLRTFTAVRCPKLTHVHDCIVFPMQGHRPHPHELSGGDLDGDIYFTIWDPTLLPTKGNYPAMNYDPYPDLELPDGQSVGVENMAQYVVDCITKDCLGAIDNTHKAIADVEGVESSKCLYLAMLHSLAVDAHKTGSWQTLPFSYRVHAYPDYMMKEDVEQYESDHVLGEIYREVSKLQSNMDASCFLEHLSPDPAFYTDGQENLYDLANSLYADYCRRINSLMSAYNISTEAELITGHIMASDVRGVKERHDIEETIAKLLRHIHQQTLSKFDEAFSGISGQYTKKQLASACYHVAYKSKRVDSCNVRISFPWLFADHLLSSRGNLDLRVTSEQATIKSIKSSLEGIYTEAYLNDQSTLLQARWEFGRAVAVHLAKDSGRSDVSVYLFGSSMYLMSNENSSVDLQIIKKSATGPVDLDLDQQRELLHSCLPTVKRYARSPEIIDAHVPVIRSRRMEIQGFRVYPVELSAKVNGIYKSALLLMFMQKYTYLMITMRVIRDWAVQVGLLTPGVHGSNIVGLTALMLIFLARCIHEGYIEDIVINDLMSFVSCILDGNVDRATIFNLVSYRSATADLMSSSRTLCVFFKTEDVAKVKLFPSLQHTLQVENNLDWSSLIHEDGIKLLNEHLLSGFISLFSSLSLSSLLSPQSITAQIILSPALSAYFSLSLTEHMKEISARTGAKVTMYPSINQLRLKLETTGSQHQVRCVRDIINTYNTRMDSRVHIGFTHNMFVPDASVVIFEHETETTQLNVEIYRGCKHQQHVGLPLHCIQYLGTNQDVHHQTYAFDLFQKKFASQLRKVREEYFSSRFGEIEFKVHFGRFYLISAPSTLVEGIPLIEPRELREKLLYSCTHDSSSNFRRSAVTAARESRGHPRQQQPPTSGSSCRFKQSFFTVVLDSENLRSQLKTLGFQKTGERQYTAVSLEINERAVMVHVNSDQTIQSVRCDKLRWCCIDVKRDFLDPRHYNMDGRINIESAEHDFRFLCNTTWIYSGRELQSNFSSLLSNWLIRCSPDDEIEIHPSHIGNTWLVRKQHIEEYHLERFDCITVPDDMQVVVELNNVTEYCRETASFIRKFSRHELQVRFVTSLNVDLALFSKLAWDLGMRFSGLATPPRHPQV